MRVRTRTVVATALVLIAVHLIAAPAASAASTATALYTFRGPHADDGANPDGGLIFDKAGNLYSTVGGGGKEGNGGAVYEISPPQGGGSPWTETLLHTFHTLTGADGVGPGGGVIFDSAGNLYGMAGGGASNNGVVYRLHPAAGGGWTETVLYSFAGGSDGAQPAGGLIFDQAGNLYGTTINGGVGGTCGAHGCGTVFELAHAHGAWTETVLHTFTGRGSDGADPTFGGLTIDRAGDLFGVTLDGGSKRSYGTVFELTPAQGVWTETTLHAFTDGADGALPTSGVILDQAGNIYGVTSSGGATAFSMGTAYELARSHGAYTFGVLHDFVMGSMGNGDGYDPSGHLTFDQAGDLYGPTFLGGAYGNGAVFKLAPLPDGSWSETILYSFGHIGAAIRGQPDENLIFDAAGNLYGITAQEGSGLDCGGISGLGCGTVYELTP